MPEALDDLLGVVRAACRPGAWSRGIELARAGAVSREGGDDDEAGFRVSTRGGMVCPRVTLFLDDADWDCECGLREGACEHVAAAVTALKQGAPMGGGGRVGYRFSRASGGLALERVIVGPDDEERELATSLSAVAERRVSGPRFLATRADLTVDVALGTHRRGLLDRAIVDRLIEPLSRCDDVRLDGKPVRVGREPVTRRLVVEDLGPGFRLRLVADPKVRERFANGFVLCDGELRPAAALDLTAREREQLERGQAFPDDAVAELVTQTLPGLRDRVPIDLRTSRLPATERVPPRLILKVDREGDALSMLATIVYGDPPRARVDADRLVRTGDGAVPERQPVAERELTQRLARAGLRPGVRARLSGAEAVAARASLAALRAEISGAALEHFRLEARLVPRAILEADEFDVRFELPGGAGGADPAAVLRAWRTGESLVALTGGGYAPLPEDWLARYGARVADLLAARAVGGGALPRGALLDLAELCEDLDHPVPPAVEGLRERLEDFDGLEAATLPADLTATLRDYQRRGVDWLTFLGDAGFGGLLADDMGLGKTLQALCAVRPRTLVVAPTSVLHNWADEIARFRPGLTCSTYHGPRRSIDRDAAVTLTTYAILRLDAEKLQAEDWNTVVLDEAQNIKNPDSRVAAAAYGLRAPFRIALTGTPVENRLDELWSQFHFTNRGLLGGRRDFKERYAEAIARGEDGAAERLRQRIRPFLLRRLKDEVAPELPPRTEMVLRCELDPEERATYDAVRAATHDEVVRRLERGGGALAALEALLRLRQAACHRGLVPGQQADDSSKLRLLVESLDEVLSEGHKALVFSQWTGLLDRVEPSLRRAGMGFARLDGATRDRAAVVSEFQSDDGPPVLLISLKAGGVGLNLTAADHVFLLDPWWNPAVEDQAADRAHRIGQDRPVLVYRLVAAETVEERILMLQERKREVAEAALGGADRAQSLTRDDLLALLG